MENLQKDYISSGEDVARLLHQDWIVDGILQQSAYVLNEGETYISVNRPAIETYDNDVSDFIDKHPSFDAILMKVRFHLLSLSRVETKLIVSEKA